MKPITSKEYDAVLDKWKEWQSFPWNQILYTISRRNIQRHLVNRQLRILDVGGGNGFNAIYFAKHGHSVTLFDYSPAMLSEAKVAAEREGVLNDITFYQGDVGTIQDDLDGQRFDVTLCHLMLEFVPEPLTVLTSICHLLAPGSFLSILDENRYSNVYRQAIQVNDLESAHQAIDIKERFHPWFHCGIPLYSSAEMIDILRANGCELVGDYGIRCVCDYLPNEPKYEETYFNALEELEHTLTDTYPYNLLARLYQVIVRKKER